MSAMTKKLDQMMQVLTDVRVFNEIEKPRSLLVKAWLNMKN